MNSDDNHVLYSTIKYTTHTHTHTQKTYAKHLHVHSHIHKFTTETLQMQKQRKKNSEKIYSNVVQNRTLNIKRNQHLTVRGRVTIEEGKDRNEQRKERKERGSNRQWFSKKQRQTNRKTKQISMYHLNNSS